MRVTMSLAVQKQLSSVKKATAAAAAVARELAKGGFIIERAAKSAAPVNFGQMRAGIRSFMARDKRSIVVRVGTPYAYARFVEFGTGPKGREGPHNETAKKLMADFGYVHGSGGKFPPLKEIARWVKQKGLDESAVFPIARAIARHGLRARPFLTPAFEAEAPKTVARIKKVVAEALRQG
jgi:HK97 gp10 family phage protein